MSIEKSTETSNVATGVTATIYRYNGISPVPERRQMDELEQWLHRVYEAGGDRATLDRLYDEWAGTYDQQLWASGNPYIAIAAGLAGRHVRSLEASILDAGCGTGNLSQVLHQIGYQNLEGLDPSEGMKTLVIVIHDEGTPPALPPGDPAE